MKNKFLQWILQNILENQTFQRTAKLIIADLYESELMKGILRYIKVYYIRKCRWDVKYLGKSLVIDREMKVEMNAQFFCWNPNVVLRLKRGRLISLVKLLITFFS